MQTLRELLCRPVQDTRRTRQYQAWIDEGVEHALERFDVERGLMGTRGIELPDEKVPGYVEMSLDERRRITSDDAAKALSDADSRSTTAVLGAMAFCYESLLSRYHRDPHILTCVRNGMEAFRKRLRGDGTWTFGLYNQTGFGLGWTVEGLIFAYVWLHDELDDGSRRGMMAMFRRAASWYAKDPGFHPISNQHAVWCANMALYGLVLDEPEHLRAAARQWETCRHVFARDGQVIEQGGPCANYSRTTFIYAYLYLFLTRDRSCDEQLKEACRWFRRMHTGSMYPFEGMSSRSAHFKTHGMMDVVPALERFAHEEPVFARFIDEFIAQEQRDHGRVPGLGHAAGPLIWAMLEHRGVVQPAPEHLAAWNRPFDRMYWKPDIQYMLVHQRYQTAVTFRGRLPLMGLQTWAWGDEPPILHPTLEVASKTLAWGVDTAEFSIGHTSPHVGAGAKSEQVIYVPGDWAEANLRYPPLGIEYGNDAPPWVKFIRWTQTHHIPGGMERMCRPGDPPQVVTRWGRLWCFHVFTPAAALVMQNGAVGHRVTRWAFNPVCCPEPQIGRDVVTFAGREGRIHFLAGRPRKESLHGVPVAEFDFEPDELAAFAFSDGSFRFLEHDRQRQTLKFSDSAGVYVVSYSNVMDDAGYVQWNDGIRANRLA